MAPQAAFWALDLPEIQQKVFEQVWIDSESAWRVPYQKRPSITRSNLLSIALTHSSWHEVAVDVMWSRIDRVEMLLNV